MTERKASGNTDNRRDGTYAGGIDYDVGDGSLAKEFMTASVNVKDAFARTVFKDELELNRALKLYHKLVKYGVTRGLNDLLMWMNGKPAVGGYNRAMALMSDSKIVVPEALGVKLGKDSMKFIEKQTAARLASHEQHDQKDIKE